MFRLPAVRLSDKPDENLTEPETQVLVKEINCDMKIYFRQSITLIPRRPTSADGQLGNGCKFEENDYVHKLCRC